MTTANTSSINIAILEDQHMVREALVRALSTIPEISVRGQFGDAKTMLLAKSVLSGLDLALVDIRLADGDSFALVEQLKAEYPKLKMIWLSSIEEVALLNRAMAMKLNGFVHKSDSLDILREAIFTVMNGKAFQSPTISVKRDRMRHDPALYTLLLSQREQEILKLLAQGFANVEVASLLCLSETTVKTHKRNIMTRLDIHKSTDLIAYALKLGLVDIRELKQV